MSRSRKLLASAALCTLGSLPWLASVTADPLDGVHLQQTVLDGQSVWNTSQNATPFRVAVIGAGAAGTSAAWWLHLASERLGHPIEVEVFERVDYIGGRTWESHSHHSHRRSYRR